MTAVGFEPTPLRTGALSQRLRPLGQTVLGTVIKIQPQNLLDIKMLRANWTDICVERIMSQVWDPHIPFQSTSKGNSQGTETHHTKSHKCLDLEC